VTDKYEEKSREAYSQLLPDEIAAIEKCREWVEQNNMELPELPVQFADLHVLTISNSSLNMFNDCARKLEFRKFYSCARWEDSHAASVGRALHEAMQEFISSRDLNSAIFKLYMNYPYQYNTNPMDDRSIESCVGWLQKFAKNSKLEDLELVNFQTADGVQMPAHEVKFHLNLPSLPIGKNPITGAPIPVIYVGFIDGVYRNVFSGKLTIVDYKTTTRNVNDWMLVYKFDQQCIPYAFVLGKLFQREFTTLDIAYLIVKLNLLEPSTIPLHLTKTQNDILDWVRGLWLQVQEIRTYATSNWWPRKNGNCMAFNRPCRYFDLCHERNPETIARLISLDENECSSDREVERPWVTLDLHINF